MKRQRKKSLLLVSSTLLSLLLPACSLTPSDSSTISDSSSVDSTPVPVDPTTDVLIGWERNQTYSTYDARRNTTDNEFGTANFISSEGKFRVGTANEVSLAPTSMYLDLTMPESDPKVVEEMPDGIDVKLSDREGKELSLEDYFDIDARAALQEEGKIKFRDDIEEDNPLDVTLTFVAPNLDNNLTYDLTIVPGAYNVTEAKELVLFDNCNTHQSYIDIKKEYLGEDATKDSGFDQLVIWNDITINKADLPSFLMWSEEDKNASPDVYGSLKYNVYIYEHEADPNGGTDQEFAIYGNYNTISLGEDFPYTVTMAEGDDWAELPDEGDIAIAMDARSALFGNRSFIKPNSDSGDSVELPAHLLFEDLGSFGNQGVSESQYVDWKNTPDDPSDDAIGIGVMFYNNVISSTLRNCSIRHFAMGVESRGPGTVEGVINAQGHRPILNIDHTRVSDIFSATFLNLNDAVINVNDSVLEDSGGLLFMNRAIPTAADPSTKWGKLGDAEKYVKGSDIFVDSDTKMQNWVTGQGGLFDIYGISGLFKTYVEPILSDPLHNAGKTIFVKDSKDSNVTRFNGIYLLLNTSNAGASMLESEPGMRAKFQIGGVSYVDTMEGKEKFDEVLAKLKAAIDEMGDIDFDNIDLATLLPLLEPIFELVPMFSTNRYAANLLMSYIIAGWMIPKTGYYLTPFTDDFEGLIESIGDLENIDINELLSSLTMTPTGGLINFLIETLLGSNPDPERVEEYTKVDPEQMDDEYITVYCDYNRILSGYGDITVESVIDEVLTYKGGNGLQAVFGLSDYEG